MLKKWSLVCVILLSIALLATGCGIPQEDYDAVIAKRDAAEAKIERMQSDLETARSDLSAVQEELDMLQRQVTSLHSELAQAQIAQAVVEEYIGKILFFAVLRMVMPRDGNSGVSKVGLLSRKTVTI
jgi:peptidoglycan hydrolase CwlO-like protein